MMQAFPTLVVSRSGQDTLLIGLLPDQCALYGVIHQLEALGLQLLEIRHPPSSVSGQDDSSRPA
jgi:epsilon-lactone hydrolase